MSNDSQSDIKTEVTATKILLEGCQPTLSSTGQYEEYGHVLQRRVEPPVIETRYSVRSSRKDDQGENISVPVPSEVHKAVTEYLANVDRLTNDHSQRSEASVEHPIPGWDQQVSEFQYYTHKVYDEQSDLLSNIMLSEYAALEAPRPFTIHVHSSVMAFLEDGGKLLGEADRPLEWDEYENKLLRTLISGKSVEALNAKTPGTVKVVFTTFLQQPTRLGRTAPSPSGGDDEGATAAGQWKVMGPEVTLSCRVTDDSPEWTLQNSERQRAYGESLERALRPYFVDNEPLIELEEDETSAQHFVVDTINFEQNLFEQAARSTAKKVTFKGDELDEDGQVIDGVSVLAAWVDPPTFNALAAQSSEQGHSYRKKYLMYERSIEEGLGIMREELESGKASDRAASFGETIWGTWEE